MSGLIPHCRAFSTEALKVINDVARQRFTVGLNNAEAYIAYEKNNKNITFITTEVPPIFQGKGIGKLLSKYAWDYAYNGKFNVTCKCHFLAEYYKKNLQTYRDLIVKMELD